MLLSFKKYAKLNFPSCLHVYDCICTSFPYPTSLKAGLNLFCLNPSTILWACYNSSPTGKHIVLQQTSERSGYEVALITFMNSLILSEIWKLRK